MGGFKKSYKVWFTTESGFELFPVVEAESKEEAVEKAREEILQEKPNIKLILRYVLRWE